MAPSRLPLADLHRHFEGAAHVERLLAERAGEPPTDWNGRHAELLAKPPGMARLRGLSRWAQDETTAVRRDEALADDVTLAGLLERAFRDAAEAGAILVEIRFGSTAPPEARLLRAFRAAEAAVQAEHPAFVAEPVIFGLWPGRARGREVLEACVQLVAEGLRGVDFLPEPYDEPADWTEAHRWADELREAGLGITAHAGEFSDVNLVPAIELPGLTRLGHAVHAGNDASLLQRIEDAGITVECCLTSNMLLGAVDSLANHALRRFIEAGIPVVLGTDDPVRMATTPEREYELARSLGLSEIELHALTRNAVEAAFTSEERREALRTALAT